MSTLEPVPQRPGADGLTSVHGGVGGIRFQWEELSRAATLLRAAAEDVQQVTGDVFAALIEAGNHQQVSGSSFPLPTAPAVMGALRAAWGSVAENERALRDAAAKISSGREAYEAAEFIAASAMGLAAGRLDLLVSVGSMGAGQGDYLKPQPIDVDLIRTELTAVDGSVHGLLKRVEHIDAEGAGHLEILKVEGPKGRAFVVSVPGTQAWSPEPSDNPWDVTGISEALGYDSAYVNRAVLQALEEAGAQTDDQLIIVGYSQGGLHAMNIAANEQIQTQFDVKMVITAGSPVANQPVAADSAYLHLEHTSDIIHRTDAAANRDRPNQTTVTLDNPVVSVEGQDSGLLGPGHKIETYLGGAKAVDASEHPSLTAASGVLGAALGVSTQATRHVFKATRAPHPSQRPTAPAPRPTGRKGGNGQS